MPENDIQVLESQLPLNMPLVRTAYEFAAYWHGKVEQKRKGSGLPYIVHPMRVAIAGMARRCSDLEICVRLNHDVKEDVEELQDSEIFRVLGPQVYMGIWWLTSPDDCDPKLAKLNRTTRKFVSESKLAYAPLEWKLAKLDDRLDNLRDVPPNDSDFYSTKYLDETRNLLSALLTGTVNRISSDPAYIALREIVDRR